MKKLILTAMLIIPFCGNAQSTLTPQEQFEKAKKEAEVAKQAVKEAKRQAKLATKQTKQKRKETEDDFLIKETKKTKIDTVQTTKNTNDNAGWTVPPTLNKDITNSKRTKDSSTTTKLNWKHDPKYLTGAVPLNAEGKVVFTLDIDVPDKNAQQIYDRVYAYLNNMSQEGEQQGSRIVLVNQNEKAIVAKYTEWLTFSESFIALDRTLFSYTIISRCSDNHLQLTLERISYNYEKGHQGELKSKAENYITDQYALNKNRTSMINGPAKFRRKTIDRKNQIFENITRALQ